MPYSDLDALKSRLPEVNILSLTDDTDTQTIDEDRVAQAIADADAIIDAHLCERYTVPLVSVPTYIQKISADLAIYNLYSRKYESEMPKAMEKRYTNAIAELKKIADGVTHLQDIDSDNGPVKPVTNKTNKSSCDRVFPGEELARW